MPEEIGGVSVGVRGDYSKLEGDFKAAEEIAKQAGANIVKALDLKQVGMHLEALGTKIASVGTSLSVAFTAPLVAAGLAALKVAGELEQASVAFNTLLGSADKAGQHLADLKKFAASTPFEFPELVNASKRLQALGFTAKEIIPTLTAVGNAAAALGTGAVGIERITLALGQMRAKGKVSAEEMRQLAEAGIPAWQILADAISKTEKRVVTVAEVMKKAEQGFIDGNIAASALLNGMQTKFGGLMEAQSKTLLGVLSNFRDKVTFLLGDIGTSLAPVAKRILDSLQGIVAVLGDVARKFSELPQGVQTAIIAFVGLVAAVGPVVFVAGKLISSFGSVLTVLGTLAPVATAAGASIGTAGLAGAFTMLGTAVAVAGAAIAAFQIGSAIYEVGRFVASLDSVQRAVEAAKGPLKGLWEIIQNIPEVKIISIVLKFAKQGMDAGSVGWLDMIAPGLSGLKKDVAEWTGTIDVGKELGKAFNFSTFKPPSFKESMDDIDEYTRKTAAARRAAEELAKALAEKLKDAFAKLDIKNLGLEVRESLTAFDLVKKSLTDIQKIAVGEKLFNLLNEAFKEGAISAGTFTRSVERIASVMDPAIERVDAARGAVQRYGEILDRTSYIETWRRHIEALGMAEAVAAADASTLEDATLELNEALKNLGTQTGLPSVDAALKELQKTMANLDDPSKLLKSVGVRDPRDLETILENNRKIQESDQYTEDIKRRANEATTRAIVQNERSIRDELANTLRAEIELKSMRGESATAQIIQLEQILIKQENLRIHTQSLGLLYVDLMKGFTRAFDMAAKSIADNIVEGKKWGDVWKDLIKSIEKMFLEILIGSAFKALGAEIIRVTGLAGGLAKVFGVSSVASGSGGGLLGGLSGLFKKGSGNPPVNLPGDLPIGGDINLDEFGNVTRTPLGGSTKTPGASGAGGLSSALGFANLGVAIASGIATGIQNAHMEADIAKIEISTRQTKEQLVNGIQSSLNQWLPKLDYLQPIWKELQDGFGALKPGLNQVTQVLQNLLADGGKGLGGGFWGTSGGPGAGTWEEIMAALKLLTQPTGGTTGEPETVGGATMSADSQRFGSMSRGFRSIAEASADLKAAGGYFLRAGEYFLDPKRLFQTVQPTGIDPSGRVVESLADIARWQKKIAEQGARFEDVNMYTGRFNQPTGDPNQVSARYTYGMQQKDISLTAGSYFSSVTGDWYPAGPAAEERKRYDSMLSKDSAYQAALKAGTISPQRPDAKWDFSDTSNPMGTLASRYAELLSRDNVTGAQTFPGSDALIAQLRKSGETDQAIYELLSRFPTGSNFSAQFSQPGYSGGGRAATDLSRFTEAYQAMQQSGGGAFDTGNSSYINIGGAATGGSTQAGMSAEQKAAAISQYAAFLQDAEAERAQQRIASENSFQNDVARFSQFLQPVAQRYMDQVPNAAEYYSRGGAFKQEFDAAFANLAETGSSHSRFIELDQIFQSFMVEEGLKARRLTQTQLDIVNATFGTYNQRTGLDPTSPDWLQTATNPFPSGPWNTRRMEAPQTNSAALLANYANRLNFPSVPVSGGAFGYSAPSSPAPPNYFGGGAPMGGNSYGGSIPITIIATDSSARSIGNGLIQVLQQNGIYR